MLEIKGLEELTKELKGIAERVGALAGEHDIPITEILTPQFMSTHTHFKNAQELFVASGFKIESPQDFKAIPEAAWDAFVRSVSAFNDWDEMLHAAVADWTRLKLRL